MKSISTRFLAVCLAHVAMLCIASRAQAQTINVNFTGNETPVPTESGLEGPGGGLGTSWNQFNGPDSPGTLVDWTGTSTSVTIDTNFDLPNTLDATSVTLKILPGSATNFGKGVDNTNVTIAGLVNGGFYDVWLVTLRNQPFGASGAEQYVGWWSVANGTTSPSDQLVDARGVSINTSTFVDGYNYVLFENVEADGSGEIVFSGVAGPLLDGSNNDHRLGLNAIQIEQTTPPAVGAVDDAMSTVEASPASVFADGVLTSTVTVTLRDAGGTGVPNKDVTLANTAGPQAATIDPVAAVTTNGAGQAVFSVSSTTAGIEVFTATDVTDALTLADTASVEFIEVGVLADAAQSTVVSSPPSVLADGSSTSTVTVTLLDADGYAVSGKQVTLANTGGPQAATISPPTAVTTDASGEADFAVSSSTIGIEEFTATDTTDSVVVAQVGTVGFIDPNTPEIISVNFNGGGDEPVGATLSGPAGGLGSVWNSVAAVDTGALKNSVGTLTGVSIDTNYENTALGSQTAGTLPVFRSQTNVFGRPNTNTVTINGLENGGLYNIWILSYRDISTGAATERNVGTWETANTTTSSSSQAVDSQAGSPDGTVFQDGYNYVLFSQVEATAGGVISFTAKGAGAGSPQDGNSRRVHLNGLQIQEAVPPSGGAYDTWADSNGLTEGVNDGQGDDADSGDLNNLGEFGLGGDPLNANDDGSLLHAFSGNVAGDSAEEGILTILVRSGTSFTSAGDPAVSDAAVDGITYSVAADTTPDVDGGGLTVTPTAAVTTGLPAAPAGYEYASFYISGTEGYFQVTVAPE